MLNDLINSILPNVSEIIPRVWLGDIDSAMNYNFLSTSQIDIIVNCTPNKPFNIEWKCEKIRIPVYDSLLEKDFILMEEYFGFVLPYLTSSYLHGKKILIHCHKGKQRSAILLSALLYILTLSNNIQIIECNKKDIPSQIFLYIRKKRPQVFIFGFRINFIKTFTRYFNLNF